MPVGAGIMQIGRENVYPTTISITSISPSITSVFCGDDITFFVSVSLIDSPSVVNDGYFDIIDLNTDTIIGSGSIYGGTGNTGLISNLSGLLNVVARYNGIPNQYSPSISSSIVYPIPLQNTTTTITSPISGSYYCYYQDLHVTALVQPAYSGSPSGEVEFRLYLDNDNYISLPNGTIDSETGLANIIIPAMTGELDGYNKYIQAIYTGSECFYPSQSDSGMDGIQIIPITEDVTGIEIDSMPGSYPIDEPITFTASVTASNLSAPDGYDGYVKFEYYNPAGGPVAELGISYMSSGTATLTVPGNTFPSVNTWYVSANFYSESECYASTETGDYTSVNVVSGAFSPLDLSGLLIWYKADSLSLSEGAPVTTWNDSSGNGKTLYVSSTTNPTYQASAIGGQPGVVFNNDVLSASGAGLPQNYNARTFYFVCSPSSINTTIGGYGTGSTGELFRTQGPFYYAMEFGGGRNSNLKGSGTAPNTPVYGCFAYATGSNVDSNSFWLNTGTGPIEYTTGSNYSAPLNTIGDTFILGTINSIPAAGVVSEVLMYNSEHGSTERNQIFNYFATKYGF